MPPRGKSKQASESTEGLITEELSTHATRITSEGVSTDDPAPTSADNPNAGKTGTNGG